MLKKTFTTTLVLLALVGCGAWGWRALKPHQPPPKVATVTATRGEFVVSLTVNGLLQSDDAVTARMGRAPGELTFIVDDGAHVQAGQVFARVESRDFVRRQTELQLSLRQAEEDIARTRESAQEDFENARRAVAQAQQDLQLWQQSNSVRVEQAARQLDFDKAELERLQMEYKRAQGLADRGWAAGSEATIAKSACDSQQFKVEQAEKDLEISRQEIASELRQRSTAVEAAQRRAEVARSRIEEQTSRAQSRAESARRDLEKLREVLADTTVLAPATGIVTLSQVFRESGRRAWKVGDGVPSRNPLGTIAGVENMSVACRVKETDISSVWKDQPAEIEFEALPGRTFEGTVSSVATVAREVDIVEDPNAKPGTRMFDTRVHVAQANPGRLKPGLNSTVQFIVKRIPNALYLPLEAVFERAGKSIVYVRQGDRFVRHEVKVGDRNDAAVVILFGLRPHDAVAMSDPTRFQGPKEKSE